jgi:hypothetical protein
MYRFVRKTLLLQVLLAIPVAATAGDSLPSLETGYRLMYGLQFDAARQELTLWQQHNLDDPRGPVSQAASLLFAEFDRLGVLEAQFYTKNSTFVSRARPKADPKIREYFYEQLDRSEAMAKKRLGKDPLNPDALFSMALVYGLRGDYAAMIENENITALRFTKQAADYARKLLAVAPDYYDAYLATGISSYIIGNLFAPVRWMLRFAGYSGNAEEGLRHLKITAERGRLLAPFARLLLAIANLRANKPGQARELLKGLSEEFPTNPLYAREIALLDSRGK